MPKTQPFSIIFLRSFIGGHSIHCFFFSSAVRLIVFELLHGFRFDSQNNNDKLVPIRHFIKFDMKFNFIALNDGFNAIKCRTQPTETIFDPT